MDTSETYEERDLVTKFRDAEDNEWDLALTMTSVRRVKVATGIDILDIVKDPSIFEKIYSDLFSLFDVVWPIISDQAEAAGISCDEFGSLMAGERILSMRDALGDGLVHFFSGPERMLLARIVLAARETEGELKKTVMDRIKSPEMDALVKRAQTQAKKEVVQKLDGKQSASGAASSESSPQTSET